MIPGIIESLINLTPNSSFKSLNCRLSDTPSLRHRQQIPLDHDWYSGLSHAGTQEVPVQVGRQEVSGIMTELFWASFYSKPTLPVQTVTITAGHRRIAADSAQRPCGGRPWIWRRTGLVTRAPGSACGLGGSLEDLEPQVTEGQSEAASASLPVTQCQSARCVL